MQVQLKIDIQTLWDQSIWILYGILMTIDKNNNYQNDSLSFILISNIIFLTVNPLQKHTGQVQNSRV